MQHVGPTEHEQIAATCTHASVCNPGFGRILSKHNLQRMHVECSHGLQQSIRAVSAVQQYELATAFVGGYDGSSEQLSRRKFQKAEKRGQSEGKKWEDE